MGNDALSPWYVFAVADGVGGHERGEWASQTAVSVLTSEVARQLAHSSALDALRAGLPRPIWSGPGRRHASRSARGDVRGDHAGGGAGQRRDAVVAHVGDSRLYPVRQGRAQRVTEDHSWVEEQVRAGFISQEDALLSDRRHAITRSIGFEPTVNVDTCR